MKVNIIYVLNCIITLVKKYWKKNAFIRIMNLDIQTGSGYYLISKTWSDSDLILRTGSGWAALLSHRACLNILGDPEVSANLFCNSRASVLWRLRDYLRLLMGRTLGSPTPKTILGRYYPLWTTVTVLRHVCMNIRSTLAHNSEMEDSIEHLEKSRMFIIFV